MFLSTLEAKEADLAATFANAICAENAEHFEFAEEELQRYRKHFSQCGCLEADNDKDYLQAVYKDECEILSTISTQTNQVAKVLDRCIAQSLAQSTGCFPLRHRFHSGVQTTEPFTLEDSDATSDGSDEMRGGSLCMSDLGFDESGSEGLDD
ncbi:hypothetical protein DFH29DRAFT_1002417 [Suillus ampliporus]|nr:hypothetical protein DFH29DRAFT_1002417 [Suillus ampliporus]